MTTDPPGNGSCRLCGRPLPTAPVTDEAGQSFCCEGCRDVQTTLAETAESDTRQTGDSETAANGPERGDSEEVVYFRIDGMHSATCEAFLESVAEGTTGVRDAKASYVTETVRVACDPDRVSRTDLRETLSPLGYTAYFRDEIADADHRTVGMSRRSREMNGLRKRRSEDLLGMRYAAGVLFAAFLMIPYVALLYPMHLASVLDWGPLELFADSFAFDSSGGLFFFRTYFVLAGLVLLFTGLPVLRGAYVSVTMRQPNTDLLVAITVVSAYLYSTIAVVLGRSDIFYDLTVVVAAVVTAAVFYESSVKRRALDRLTDLTVSDVTTARLYADDGTTTEVAVEDVTPGDRVLVRQGERIPVDGVLVEGTCTVNESVVTGESLPVLKHAGDDLVGGSIVTDNAATVAVGDSAAHRGADSRMESGDSEAGTWRESGSEVTSSIDRLTTAVWNLQSADHGVQRRADRLAASIIPPLVGIAVVVGVLSLFVSPASGLVAFLTVFIVGCPWVLGFATPLSVATSLEAALEQGVVVFDETVFERLRETDVIVFDKTGTLTTGEMEIIDAGAPADLLAAAAALERMAAHPAANAIVEAFADETDTQNSRLDGGEADRDDSQSQRVSEFETHGNGVGGVVDGSEILVGNLECFIEQGWTVSDDIETRVEDARGFGRLPVVVGRDGVADGLIVVGDEPREGWETALTQLGERGAEIVVLTGDDEEATDYFRRHPHVSHVFAGVPPDGKTATIRRLRSRGQVTMVGDGTNDAPALAVADLGISIASGTALAADAADMTIVDSDLASVETAFDVASAAARRVRQNTRFALVYNGLAIPIAIAGVLNPLTAAAVVLTSCGLIVANCSRELV